MDAREKFREAEFCERCQSELAGKTMSWFTTETICVYCSSWENLIIEESEKDREELEGIGEVPDVEMDIEIQWGEELPDSVM